jgi:hypothetical protein
VKKDKKKDKKTRQTQLEKQADKMLKRDEHFQKLKNSKGIDPDKLKNLF